MDAIKDETMHNTALKLAEEIKNLSIYKSFYSDVQVPFHFSTHNSQPIV